MKATELWKFYFITHILLLYVRIRYLSLKHFSMVLVCQYIHLFIYTHVYQYLCYVFDEEKKENKSSKLRLHTSRILSFVPNMLYLKLN